MESQKLRIYLTVCLLLLISASILFGFVYTLTHQNTNETTETTKNHVVRWSKAEARSIANVPWKTHLGETGATTDWQGQWSFVFFGFTHCPDICPATLYTLSQVRDQLKNSERMRTTQYILVTVDPARDTPSQLARYLIPFGKNFVGLRTTAEDLNTITREFGVAISTAYGDDKKESISHTTALFLINPDAK
ncbi:MAG TPA: hypothetical protein DCZ03_02225, partial [Gammaproteobacteria bacterium]|nr:hypothetical protein [Gammaproteobacteria bacterium]